MKISVVLALVALCLAAAAETPVIRGEKFANWWVLGEKVSFKAEGEVGSPVEVLIFDSSGREVSRTVVPAERFRHEGWSFRPEAPGFFEAEFRLSGKPVAETYSLGPKEKPEVFSVARHPFAVVPEASKAPLETSPHFGASVGMKTETIGVARLVGFRSLRLHWVPWDMLEPEKGRFTWEPLDEIMRAIRENGYAEDSVVFNVLAVPRWASTRPEATKINICVREYATVRPKDYDDWRNFLRQLIRRYPGVNRYELWNEPHLPGNSCFWADSVKNFAELLKAGYKTVKAEKPGSTVWLGGIGMRYLPFYEELLQFGGGACFDVLPLHGSWMNPAPFHRLEKRFGVAEKPVVSSEWHAMLLGPTAGEWPTEKALARNMLIDFLHQIRSGISEVDFFSMINLPSRERETLPYLHRTGKRQTHVSGLFRGKPYLQPRYPAVAWHNWIGNVKGTLRIGDGFLFDGGRQRALYFESENGPMLLFWNDTAEALPAAPELLRAFGENARAVDPEGVGHPAANLRLAPEIYYLLPAPVPAAVRGWEAFRGEVLVKNQAALPLEHEFSAVYRDGELFDAAFRLREPETIRFAAVDRNVAVRKGTPPCEVRGRFAVGFTEKYLDLQVETEDPVHVNYATDGRLWEYDSIQFALDTKGFGHAADRVEFAAGLDREGRSRLWKIFVPALDGDLPGEYTYGSEPVRYAKCVIEHRNGKTVYKLRINASELYPFRIADQIIPRFSLLINNNDGDGRAAYAEWGGGIGDVKNPCRYGDLTVRPKEKSFPAQKNLTGKGWKKDDYTLTVTPASVVVHGASPTCSGVRSVPWPVTAGAAYRIRFEARGKAALRLMAAGKDLPRTDLLVGAGLTGEWRDFSLVFRAPAGAKNVVYAFFAWKQPGCEFEIRNFKVEEE